MTPIHKATATILLMTLIAGCQPAVQNPPRQRDGKLHGVTQGSFRHRWWNYYERGLSFAEGRFYDEALADLAESARQRGEDQRMARTYGMHFVDYFPHREMGVIHYLTGDLEAARQELKKSLAQHPSAKAQFYLDRVRGAALRRSVRDPEPPVLTLDVGDGPIWTRDDPVRLTGSAQDDHFVASVAVDGQAVFMEGARKRVAFDKSLSLDGGEHVVRVTAKNLLDRTAEREVVFRVDRDGPLVSIESMTRSGSDWTVAGSVYDPAGVASIELGGRPLPFDPGTEVPFTESAPAGNGPPELKVADRLGNETAAYLEEIPPRRDTARLSAALASDRLLSLFGPKDEDAPVIELKDWPEGETVYLDKIYLSGRAMDQNAVLKLLVNNRPIMRKEGQSVFFNHLAALKEGENTIAVEAQDAAGNKTLETATVIRRVPEALQLDERLRVSVFPFQRKGEASPWSMAYQDQLVEALMGRNRFKLIERNRLDQILKEQKLSMTGLVDQAAAIRTGKLLAAQCIVVGNIIETHTGIEIVGRMIDTETAEILSTKDVYDEVKDFEATQVLAEGMAVKFHQDFPLVGGIVLLKKGNEIFTDLGADKIALKHRLLVYREEPVLHPITGKPMGADAVIIGNAVVNLVDADMSKAELTGNASADIKKLDRVITQ
jgi:TolB-like protein